MLQSVLVPKEIVDNPAWLNAVTRAGEWVSETLGQWAVNKHFAWRVIEPSGKEPLFDFRIESEGSTVAQRFDWFDVNNEREFKRRIREMWGDLTDQTIHSIVVNLKQLREEWTREDALAAAN